MSMISCLCKPGEAMRRALFAALASLLVLTGIDFAVLSAAAQTVLEQASEASDVPVLRATARATYPHDPSAFTQGLTFAEGQLYEGTGLYGESSLRRVDLNSGSVLQKVDLPRDVFGEGIAAVGDRMAQLTWQSQLGYVYERASFRPLGTFHYATEGWGLTYDGTRLIMSDGTDVLRFLDPDTFAEVGQIQVRAGGRPVPQLNELEYVEGVLLANVWRTDLIAVIDPATGDLLAWIDLTGLNPAPRSSPDDVLNGIAYEASTGQLYVTGKRWPQLYEIEVELPAAAGSSP